MNKKEANKIIAEFMEEDVCFCDIPSPSIHHDHCLNKKCKKVITDLTWRNYTDSLDALYLYY